MSTWKCLELIKGTTKNYEIKFTKNGTAQDITGWTVFFTLKESMKDPDSSAIIRKDITIHEDASSGISVIELTSTDTDIDPGTYYFDIKYKDNESPPNIGVLFMGRLKVIESVTQRS